MKMQPPIESVVARTVTALRRGDIDAWSTRLFSPDVALEIAYEDGVVRGPDDVARHLDMLGARTTPPKSTLFDSGATLLFDRCEVYLKLGRERIDSVWFYPPGEPPVAVLQAQDDPDVEPPPSCCGGGR